MEVVCAWCNRQLSEQGEGAFTSHGICETCRKQLLTSDDVDETISSAPTLLIEKDHSIRYASASALNIISDELREKITMGKLIGCENAQGDIPCGKGKVCQSCTLKRSVKYTYDTDQPQKMVTEVRNLVLDGSIQKYQLTFSTKKFDEFVLLKIDEIKPKKTSNEDLTP